MPKRRHHATTHTRRRLALPGLLLALMTLLGGAGLALPEAVAAQQAYNVEMIIFRQFEARGDDAEAWPLTVTPPQFGRVRQLGSSGFDRLPGNQLRLHGARQRLQQSDAYEPLLHIGWRQEGLPRNRSVAIGIPPGWTPPEDADNWDASMEAAQLYGLVRIYRERFLHAVVDLRYRRSVDDRDTVLPSGAVHALQESRRMRSEELHYLDHPALGVLIEIRPVD